MTSPSQLREFDLLKRKKRVARFLMPLWWGLVLSGFLVFIHLEHSGQLVKRVDTETVRKSHLRKDTEVYRDHKDRVYIYFDRVGRIVLTAHGARSVENKGLVPLPFGYALFRGGKPGIIGTSNIWLGNVLRLDKLRVENKWVTGLHLVNRMFGVVWGYREE